MKRILILTIALLLSPSFALAAEAGFPSQTIWISNSSAVEGDTIVVSAVVYNGESSALRGTLVFTEDGTRIGARELDIPGGESQVHSVEWKPKAGEYALAARIEGTSASLSKSETPSLSVSVAERPTPSVVVQTISQVVETASTIASSSAPFISQAVNAVFTQTEALRTAGIDRLENYLSQSNVQGFVAGTSTSSLGSTTPQSTTSKGAGIFSNIAHTAAAAALFTMKNVVLFYPLLALCFFALLYALARGIRRPSN